MTYYSRSQFGLYSQRRNTAVEENWSTMIIKVACVGEDWWQGGQIAECPNLRDKRV